MVIFTTVSKRESGLTLFISRPMIIQRTVTSFAWSSTSGALLLSCSWASSIRDLALLGTKTDLNKLERISKKPHNFYLRFVSMPKILCFQSNHLGITPVDLKYSGWNLLLITSTPKKKKKNWKQRPPKSRAFQGPFCPDNHKRQTTEGAFHSLEFCQPNCPFVNGMPHFEELVQRSSYLQKSGMLHYEGI